MKGLALMHPTALAPAASDSVQPFVLSSGAGQAFDTPSGAAFVLISASTSVWVRFGSTAAVAPTSSSTAFANSEINPGLRNITSTASCTGISLYSEAACKGSIAWYR